ncbi:MAG: general stress protein [Candidatus Eremiobacteraeota bacterium]|nr:general stress protein [Candidatus Eremiobacteraeota bacterium]
MNNNSTNNNFEGGMYYDRDRAEDAVSRLHGLGYGQNDISVMAKDKDRAKEFAEATGTKSSQGAVTGGAIGGALGAIIAGLTATGSIAAIAGTGGLAAPLVVGPLAAALAGLGGGGLVGGIIGGLVGAGIPEDRAKEYEAGLNKGGMLIGVNARDEHRDQIRSIFTPTGTTQTSGSVEDSRMSDRSGAMAADAADIPPRRSV